MNAAFTNAALAEGAGVTVTDGLNGDMERTRLRCSGAMLISDLRASSATSMPISMMGLPPAPTPRLGRLSNHSEDEFCSRS